MKNVWVLCLLLALTLGEEVDVTTKQNVVGDIQLSNLNISTNKEKQLIFSRTVIHVYGNNFHFRGFVQSNGSFVVNKVPPGAYVLDVASPDLVFTQINIDISKKVNGKTKAREFGNKRELKYPLHIYPISTINYFEEIPALGLLNMIMGNSMFWIFGVTMIMMFFF